MDNNSDKTKDKEKEIKEEEKSKNDCEIIENELKNNYEITERDLKMKNEVVTLLLKLGCRANLSGFDYLVDSLIYMYNNNGRRVKHSEELLSYLAIRYKKNVQAIENALRHIIVDLWNVGRIEDMNKVLNLNVFRKNEKPSVTMFLNILLKILLILFST